MRNHLAAAAAQNLATWGDLPRSSVGYIAKAEVEFEEAAHASQARYLRHRDERLRERIRDATAAPSLFHRSVYFRRVLVGVFSPDDAVRELAKLLRREQSRIRRKHWSCANHAGELDEIKEAMAFARFFRRYGQRVWMRSAA